MDAHELLKAMGASLHKWGEEWEHFRNPPTKLRVREDVYKCLAEHWFANESPRPGAMGPHGVSGFTVYGVPMHLELSMNDPVPFMFAR